VIMTIIGAMLLVLCGSDLFFWRNDITKLVDKTYKQYTNSERNPLRLLHNKKFQRQSYPKRIYQLVNNK
jgi:hypothetical protein